MAAAEAQLRMSANWRMSWGIVLETADCWHQPRQICFLQQTHLLSRVACLALPKLNHQWKCREMQAITAAASSESAVVQYSQDKYQYMTSKMSSTKHAKPRLLLGCKCPFSGI